jgi:hypothetical protein
MDLVHIVTISNMSNFLLQLNQFSINNYYIYIYIYCKNLFERMYGSPLDKIYWSFVERIIHTCA